MKLGYKATIGELFTIGTQVLTRRKSGGVRPEPRKWNSAATDATELRIIGGAYRRRKLLYHGDPRTRPMKERVREAVFNLVGAEMDGTHAIDLFAGTGAMGLEAMSRGASRATFFEQHRPTATWIRKNIELLEVESSSEVITANTFFWFRDRLPDTTSPWAVFCCPPYDLYVSRRADMMWLLDRIMRAAPDGSVVIVESDERFDRDALPFRDEVVWDSRSYPPAIVSVCRLTQADDTFAV